MGGWKYNSSWKTEDIDSTITSVGDTRYVLKAGDTMTGALVIKPSSGNDALVVQQGKRLVLDGES